MFDIGFGELMLVFVIGLVVLGPERLPVAVRTVAGWIRAIRSMASTVQNELTQELKLQDSLKKVEEASKNNLSPELKASMEELREAAESMKKEFKGINSATLEPAEPHTIHNPLVTDPEALHDGVTPAEGDRQAEAPPMAPSVAASAAAESVVDPTAQTAAYETVQPAARPSTPADPVADPTAQTAASETVQPVAAGANASPTSPGAMASASVDSVANPATPASAPAAPAQEESGREATATRPASSTSPLNNDR
ncbi:Sec-independent protein translocase subunit TatB [Candidatus Sodalis endolongispinus]|uniref:Sec-independent protein translocase protein TatB n=1 Tax=Candidatus Sodalis endolongispinus TaxID=2812662 RepID=A0ABS5YDI8_9GAMM|nr:Sec-independent protein translocase subunit TatB [Candidatus Sodalis endolongispinus]